MDEGDTEIAVLVAKLLKRDMSIKELSEKLGYKGANLYNKLDRDNFSEKELRAIAEVVNRQPLADDLDVNGEGFLISIRQPMAGDIDWNEFISLGFTHHMEILSKTKEISERLFYIHECAVRAWDKYKKPHFIMVCDINKRTAATWGIVHTFSLQARSVIILILGG